MLYVLALILLIIIYISVIFLMRYMRCVRLWNTLFSVSIFALYLSVVLTVYLDVGFDDWNFQNTLPTANVSPFMFTLVPLMHLLPRKIKRHIYLLVSLLSVGMFLAAVFGCVYNAAISYKFHLHFFADYLAHVLLSLWGVYLVVTRQVELKIKNGVISSSLIIAAAVVMLILNLIFDTAFFGLSLYGKHNIYNNVLTESSHLSALLYFSGLSGVLAIGYLYSTLFLGRGEKDGAKKE